MREKEAFRKTVIDLISWCFSSIFVVGILVLVVAYSKIIYGLIADAINAGVMTGAVLVGFVLFLFFVKYKHNLKKLNTEAQELAYIESLRSSSPPSGWFQSEEIPTSIPEGRYNVQLSSGKILWNITEQDFESHRLEVSEWLDKHRLDRRRRN